MTLEKHIMDTMKEWQIKLGSIGSDMKLYYPKTSLYEYLKISNDISCTELKEYIKKHLSVHAECLGEITVSHDDDRFCICIGKEGCRYVEQNIPEPDFLKKFLEALKSQNMDIIFRIFKEYAMENSTELCVEHEAGGATEVLYLKDETVEPYVYYIEQNEFGITYHRFTSNEYKNL
ncbi:MAG: DUF3877 family protein [Lachnospiraceae bacterium]|nr:DUF3877 family protein [Lachnospiraceae bacterium]